MLNQIFDPDPLTSVSGCMMNVIFLQTFSLFFYAIDCKSIDRFEDGNFLGEHHPRELNGIIKHCGDEDSYEKLTMISAGEDLGLEFYRNFHEMLLIPIEIFHDLDHMNSVGWQSCVILCVPGDRVNDFLKIIFEYTWLPGNIYVIYVPGEETDTFLEEKIWLLSAAGLWREKYIHKLIISTNGRNLFFDPFEPSEKKILNEESWNFTGTNFSGMNFGAMKDLEDNSYGLLKIRDTFGGYEANVALFPYVTVEKDVNDDWIGPDVHAMIEIFKLMNISHSIFDPPEKFGWFSDGKFHGTLGRLVYHHSDFAFNGFFVKSYSSEMLEFSTYLNTDKICVIVPKRARVPEYLLIARIFSLYSWVLICVGNSLVAFTYVGMTSVDFGARPVKTTFGDPSTLWKSNLTRVRRFIETWIFLCFYPAKMNDGRFGQRIQIACGLMLGIVIGGAFTSQLASSFSKPAFLKNINTLAELDDSGLEILTSFPNLLNDVFADNESSTYRNLQAKLKLKNASEIETQVLHTRNAGYLDRLQALILDENSNHKVHVVSEFPQTYPLAYPIAKGSPFLPRMNTLIGRFHNGGLYGKWFEDLEKVVKNDGKQRPVVIRLPHLYIPFFMLFVGLGIAGGVFCFEINCAYLNRTTKPKTDVPRQ